jgi:predicted nucleic acid-binding protein
VAGLTLDTGALIAIEKRKMRARKIIIAAMWGGDRITVPAAVVAEWWRGPAPSARKILDAMIIEPVHDAVARLAGEALALVGKGPSAIDAIVMASAAQRGDVVLTSDVGDLQNLQRAFPGVRLVSV